MPNQSRVLKLTAALGALAATVFAAFAVADSSASAGREEFEKRCTGCHTLDNIKLGPPLRGVYGRKAGADPRFPYSEAVKNASVIWNDSTLDRWLTDTDGLIPGNEMAFRLNNKADRADIIAYLKELPGK